MEKWYDEFAANCGDCGFLKKGEYLDGMPYLSCKRFGTIMHRQTEVVCEGWRSPEYVKQLLNKQKKK